MDAQEEATGVGVEEIWQSVKSIYVETGKEVLGYSTRKRKEWISGNYVDFNRRKERDKESDAKQYATQSSPKTSKSNTKLRIKLLRKALVKTKEIISKIKQKKQKRQQR